MTIDKMHLLRKIGKTRAKKVVTLRELALEVDFAVADLFDLCYYPEKPIAFRAAWIMEIIESKYPSLFIRILKAFMQNLAKQHNESCQRHFSKILLQYTKPKASKTRKKAFSALPTVCKEQMVEVLFEWLIKPGSPVAVQVNCMEVLCYMVPTFPWIKEELEAQILFYLKDGSAAIQSRGRKLLHRLREMP